MLQQIEHLTDRGGAFQIDLNHLAASRRGRLLILLCPHAIESDDFCAHVRKHHAGERPRSDTGELDNTDAGQRTSGPDR